MACNDFSVSRSIKPLQWLVMILLYLDQSPLKERQQAVFQNPLYHMLFPKSVTHQTQLLSLPGMK